MPILGSVIDDAFPAVMAAAQDGSEGAFATLWRDANPALLRYLRVATLDAAEDVAAETWVQVIRGLPGFRGDEQAWRAWLFTTARRRALDEARRRARHPVAPLSELPVTLAPRAEDAAGLALENLATAAAIAAISELPPLQAEVILLRVLAGGAANVTAYCAAVAHPGTTTSGASASNSRGKSASHPHGKSTTHPTGKPTKHPTGKPSNHPAGKPPAIPPASPPAIPPVPPSLARNPATRHELDEEQRCDVGSVAIACATRRQPGEVVEGDVPDDFDDELGREFGRGVL